MYDNINITVLQDHCPGTDFLKVIPERLNVINAGTNHYGEYVTGFLDSLKISVSANRVKVYDSSLCKYFLGDNFKTLSKGDTRRAIEKISDSLGLPIAKGKVTGIDFSNNFIMKHPEQVYYPCLGQAQYYSRLEQNNGLYFKNGKRQLLFYGKLYEQQVKKQPIPELYRNRNVLRFEMRLRKRLNEQLKIPEITAGLLWNETFYGELVKRWRNEYLSIQKINSKLDVMKPTGSTKELIENLALQTILNVGQHQVLTKVKEWQKRKEIDKFQARRLLNKIKQMSKAKKREKENDLIQELDKKIKEAARYY